MTRAGRIDGLFLPNGKRRLFIEFVVISRFLNEQFVFVAGRSW